MDKFKRTLSLKKKKDAGAESSKPHQWQEDERKVREGCCSFHVKYLGCIEVFESRGIQVCEEAVKALKNKKSRSFWSRMSLRRKKKDENQQSKSGHHMAVLYVTGDALRVVDDISKGLIVDQTIEKVSFCAPDRNHDRGFAYICRDGTTRRWMCHGFLAIKESGERLSHAVGCAFAICLEKKQQREKEKVSVTYNDNGTSFTRLGSFRQASMTERLADPQSAILAEPVPSKPASNPYAVQRPHAPVDMLERQGSFRSFQKLADSSPFKRNVSLRLNELPSNLERQKQFTGLDGPQLAIGKNIISTIVEAEEQDPFSPSSPREVFAALQINSSTSPTTATTTTINNNIPPINNTSAASKHGDRNTSSLFPMLSSPAVNSSKPKSNPVTSLNPDAQALPITQNNPWAKNIEKSLHSSEAESWLNATANKIDPFAAAPSNNVFATRSHQQQATQPHQQHFPGMAISSFSGQSGTAPQTGYAGVVPMSSSIQFNHHQQQQQFYPSVYSHVHHQQHVQSHPGAMVTQDGIFLQSSSSQQPVNHQFLVSHSNPQNNTNNFFGVQTSNSGSAWSSSATNPFNQGSDVPSFQLKI